MRVPSSLRHCSMQGDTAVSHQLLEETVAANRRVGERRRLARSWTPWLLLPPLRDNPRRPLKLLARACNSGCTKETFEHALELAFDCDADCTTTTRAATG
jgi:hypothetical protein